MVALGPGMKLPRTHPVMGRPLSVATGMSIRMRPAGTSHCHPIQSSVNPWRISAPLPNSASVEGSAELLAPWNVDRMRIVPRLPAS